MIKRKLENVYSYISNCFYMPLWGWADEFPLIYYITVIYESLSSYFIWKKIQRC